MRAFLKLFNIHINVKLYNFFLIVITLAGMLMMGGQSEFIDLIEGTKHDLNKFIQDISKDIPKEEISKEKSQDNHSANQNEQSK